MVPFLALLGVSLPLSHASFGELRCFMLFTHGLYTRYLHSEGKSGWHVAEPHFTATEKLGITTQKSTSALIAGTFLLMTEQ